MSHFEYCNSLVIGVNKTLKKELEDDNHYGLGAIMNTGKNSDYESLFKIEDMNSLEHRRIELNHWQYSLNVLRRMDLNGSCYIGNLLKPFSHLTILEVMGWM